MKSSMPTFALLNKALSKTTLKLHASQAHGLICALLCGIINNHQSICKKLGISKKKSSKAYDLIQTLCDISAKQLSEFSFDFQLLLPVDSEKLLKRTEALTLWCQGFLTGLKMLGVPIQRREPSELTEAIVDLIEIAKMNYEEVKSSEEDEVAYVELVEYVRLAAILIFQNIHQPSGESKKVLNSSNLLH